MPIITLFVFIGCLILMEYIRFRGSQYKGASINNFVDTYKNRGVKGEYEVYLSLVGVPGYGKCIPNVYVPKENGETTEIDLVFIHETGIYVFESKNWTGTVTGDMDSKEWSLRLGSKNYKDYSPVKQNNGHIKHLRAFLGHDSCQPPYYSMIVFGNDAIIDGVDVCDEFIRVLNTRELSNKMRAMVFEEEEKLSREEVDMIARTLLAHTQPCETVKQSHVRSIHKRKSHG